MSLVCNKTKCFAHCCIYYSFTCKKKLGYIQSVVKVRYLYKKLCKKLCKPPLHMVFSLQVLENPTNIVCMYKSAIFLCNLCLGSLNEFNHNFPSNQISHFLPALLKAL